jgi:hypothetical protein
MFVEKFYSRCGGKDASGLLDLLALAKNHAFLPSGYTAESLIR